MFRRIVDSFLGASLAILLLPFVILPALCAQLRRAWSAGARRQERACATNPPVQSLAGEFQFDRAIEAYEHLIDTVLAERGA